MVSYSFGIPNRMKFSFYSAHRRMNFFQLVTSDYYIHASLQTFIMQHVLVSENYDDNGVQYM